MNVRPLSRPHPCAVCDQRMLTPTGSEDEYDLVLTGTCRSFPHNPAIPPCHIVCAECSTRLMGPRVDGRPSNPTGVRAALQERYGWCDRWTSPDSLAGLLYLAAEYLASAEARDGMTFGDWQKWWALYG